MGFLSRYFRTRDLTLDEAAAELIANHLREHGCPTRVTKNAFVPESLGYPCECRVHLTGQETVRLQLDVTTWLAPDSGFAILESLAGTGATDEDCLTDSTHKWLHNVYPVLESGLADRPHPTVQKFRLALREQGRREPVEWHAHVGPLLLLSSRPDIGKDLPLFETIAPALQTLDAAGEVAWLRAFVGGQDAASLRYECLLMNDPWEEGAKALASAPWPTQGELLTARQFTILRRAD